MTRTSRESRSASERMMPANFSHLHHVDRVSAPCQRQGCYARLRCQFLSTRCVGDRLLVGQRTTHVRLVRYRRAAARFCVAIQPSHSSRHRPPLGSDLVVARAHKAAMTMVERWRPRTPLPADLEHRAKMSKFSSVISPTPAKRLAHIVTYWSIMFFGAAGSVIRSPPSGVQNRRGHRRLRQPRRLG